MSSVRDSRLRINVDVENAKRKAKELSQDLVKMGNAGQRGGAAINTGMVQASQGIRQAADASAAAQIRFQTMTQGMLNLSTASIQTFTSISNLARAENRAKASTIAVSRAVDLLANKRERLNDLLRSGIASEQKMINIRREITTATNDLVVKQEKMEIETKAVLDIQLLFFASLTNVGVSSYQTISTMISRNTKAMIANAVSTRFNSVAQFNNRNALFGNVIARKISTLTLSRQAIALTGATLATRLQTLALRGLKIALGPIGLIFIGISAAMVAYQTNALGLKDTINSLLGIQDEQTESMEEGADAANELAEGMAGINQELFKMPNSIASAVEQLARLQRKFREVNVEAKEQAIIIEGLGAATKDFKAGAAPPSKVGGGTLPINVFGALRGIRLFQKPQFNINATGSLVGNVIDTTPIDPGKRPKAGFTSGGFLQVQINKTKIAAEFGFTRDEFDALEDIEQQFLEFILIQQPLLQKAITDPSVSAGVAAETALGKTFKLFITPEDEFIIEQLVIKGKAADKFNKDLEILFRRSQLASPIEIRKELGRAILAAQQFDIPLASLLKPDLIKTFSQGKKVGNVINGKFFGSDKDAERFLFATMFARNVGPLGTNTGRALHPSAFRLTGNQQLSRIFNERFTGGLQVGTTQRGGPTSISKFLQAPSRLQQRGVIRPQGLSVAGSLSGDTQEVLLALGFGGAGIGGGVAALAVSNFSTRRQQQAFIEAFESSGSISQALSETHQFSKQQLLTLQQRAVVIAIEDRNRNKLRTGGRRVLDESGVPLPLSDPGAIIGGFLNISMARRAWREQARRTTFRNLIFGAAIGFDPGFGGKGGSQLKRRAGAAAQILLARTGLSISVSRFGVSSRIIERNKIIMAMARQKAVFGTELLGIDPRFIDSLTASLSLDELQLRATEENRFINQADIALEENRQEIIRIRFDANRGDRELLNRLRFVERLEAASSGTSPL